VRFQSTINPNAHYEPHPWLNEKSNQDEKEGKP
jgi:hypothetical protein